MRNIIITGGELFNKGAQAMTFITVDELKKRFPEHQIYVLSPMDLQRHPSEREKYAFEFMGWYPIKFAHCQSNPLARKMNMLRNGNELREAEAIYKNTDMMIDISGYALGSNWNYEYCNTYLEHLEFAKAFGIPVYLMPQSFGPFEFSGDKGRELDQRIRKLLPGVKTICAREQEGYDSLVNTYHLNNVCLKGDLVLNNKGIDLANIYKEVSQIQIPEIKDNSVGIIPNGRTIAVGDKENVLLFYKTIIKRLLFLDKNIYLVSHSSQDSELCEAIKNMFSDNENVVFLSEDFSCLEFNELVKEFRYVVASRFHSIVHAYKNGVPCVVLGWATKYHELLEQFGQIRYMFDVRDNLEMDTVCKVIEEMDSSYTVESSKILNCLTTVQKENVFDILSL